MEQWDTFIQNNIKKLKLYNIVSDGGEHVGTSNHLLKTDEVGSLLYVYCSACKYWYEPLVFLISLIQSWFKQM